MPVKKVKSQKLKVKTAKQAVPQATQVVVGRVVVAKLPKTVSVLVERRKTHPMYKKSYAQSQKYLAHDEIGLALGDVVEMVKVRPISKHKHWQVVKVLGRDLETMVTTELKKEAAEAIAEVLPQEAEKSSTDSSESSNKVSEDQETKVKTKKVKKVKEEKA